MKFVKYHGLGNDYIVIDPADLDKELDEQAIKAICHRNYGPGSDGILFGPLSSKDCDFALRILNPDGSEAEKSGNGLRIFSRYLWDRKLVGNEPFTLETLGGKVTSQVFDDGKMATVDMGHVSFSSSEIPVQGAAREVLNETFELDGVALKFCAATIGNPHCVVLRDDISAEDACKWGPSIETDLRFPNKTNVQFMKVLDHANIQIEIWERGAGYTLASGSSSSAAAAVAHKLGFCGSDITVHMPGGTLQISIHDDFFITMTGPIAKACEGTISDEVFEQMI